MTHGKNDDGENTRIDGSKLLNLPLGLHLDTHEAKWALAGILAGFIAAATGRKEIAVVVGGAALGLRAAPGPLKKYVRQPWWTVFGLVFGLAIGGLYRAYRQVVLV